MQQPTENTAIKYNEDDAKHEYDKDKPTGSTLTNQDPNPAKTPSPTKPSRPRPRF